MYWNINQILPFQRPFNFINGPRSIGKTYTTLKWFVKQFLKTEKQFVYICRTQDEKKHGVMEHALRKVLENEFPDLEVEFDTFQGKIHGKTMCWCIALSEYVKIKKYAFPEVYYLIFDEYMIEENSSVRYVTGWGEPELFISIYHTIDREEERVMCFMLGNNTSFYNPYHIYPMFNIPFIEDGQIWHNKICLFQRAKPSEELNKKRSKNKMLKYLEGTHYGESMVSGTYTGDNFDFIKKLTNNHKYIGTLAYNRDLYGVYVAQDGIVISSKVDKTFPRIQALTKEDVIENSFFLPPNKSYFLKLIVEQFKMARLGYENIIIKNKLHEGILRVVR